MFKAAQCLASAALGVANMSWSDDDDQEPPRWPSVNYSAFGLVCRIQFLCTVQACLSDEQTHMSSKTPDTPYVHVSEDATLKGFTTRCSRSLITRLPCHGDTCFQLGVVGTKMPSVPLFALLQIICILCSFFMTNDTFTCSYKEHHRCWRRMQYLICHVIAHVATSWLLTT